MIPVSKQIRQECNKDSISYREYIVIDGKEIDIRGKMYQSAYKDTHFIGTFNPNYMKFKTENDIDYKQKEFTYYKSVNGNTFKIGSYIVTEIKNNDTDETVEVTAYDYGIKFARPYTTKLNYASGRITMYQVLKEACNNCGVELENGDITNGDFIIDSNQFVNGEQFGDVISAIAFMSGNFATINSNDKLELLLYKRTIGDYETDLLTTEDAQFIMTEDGDYIATDGLDYIEDYVELEDKRDTRPITCVKLGWTDVEGGAVRRDEELIKQYGENWLIINDCPIAYSSEKQETLINEIFDRVKGFGYSAFVSKYAFKPYYSLGDLIKFRNKEGNLVQSIVLRIETDYDDIILSAPSVTNASIEYDYPETIEEQVRRASFKVDQANSQIVLKAQDDGTLVLAELKADAENGSQFNVKADNINLEGYTTINNGFNVDLNGNPIINGGKIEIVSTDTQNANLKIYDTNKNNYASFTNNAIISNDGIGRFDIYAREDNSAGISSILSNIGGFSYTIMKDGVGEGTFASTNAELDINFYPGLCNLKLNGKSTNTPSLIVSAQNTNNTTSITPNGVWSPGFNQNSTESKKKNIEKQDKVLEKIYNADICNYNWKFEDDTDKKHIGLVINDLGGNYNTPDEAITHDRDAIELYSMCGMSWKAIQELYDIIKVQQDKIDELERKLSNGVK